MKKTLAFLILNASFLILHSQSQPKLVVGIVIDQMRYDYISKYWNKYGDDGFKRIVTGGFFCKNTHYNYTPTFTGPGHAAIYTGCTPSQNGIIANDWYDRESKAYVYCVEDKNVQTLGGRENSGSMSPKRMMAPTVCDQLKTSTNFQSKVIGIALKDRGAILSAGHSANAAYWYDGKTGKFISSTYYMKALPAWINEFNGKMLPQQYLNTTWTTLLPIEQYTESIADDNNFEEPFKTKTKPIFPYNLKELMKENENLGMIRSTPFGNTLTTDVAISAIKGENLGKGNFTDMLTVSYSATDYVGHRFGPTSVEVEDTYLRLDKDLAIFFTFLDSWVGKNNYLLFVTADHGAVEVPAYLKANKIPAGNFNEGELEKKLKILLKNTYNDSLVLSIGNQQVYLNEPRISELKLAKKDVYETIINVVLKMEEVASVYTDEQINNWSQVDGIKYFIENGYNQKRSGNIIINLKANWIGNETIKGTTHGSAYNYDTHAPLIWYGWNIKAGSTNEKVNITDIAPTLSNLLNIEVPAATSGVAIKELIK